MFNEATPDRRNVPESKPTPWLGLAVAIAIVALCIYVIKNSQKTANHPATSLEITTNQN